MKLMGVPNLDQLAALIRRKRMELRPRQSLRFFASRCNISPAYLCFIETGILKSPPTTKVLSTIAYELELDSLVLFLLAGRIDEKYYDKLQKSKKKHPDWRPLRKKKNRDIHGNIRPDEPYVRS